MSKIQGFYRYRLSHVRGCAYCSIKVSTSEVTVSDSLAAAATAHLKKTWKVMLAVA